MSNINVINVSYRNKNIVTTIDEMHEKSYYKSNIFYHVASLNSWRVKFNLNNINIMNAPWDLPVGFIKHQYNFLNGCHNDSYVLFITPECSFEEHWDKKIIEHFNLNPNVFISETSGLNPFFMFTSKFNLMKTGYPHYLNLLGAKEDLEIRAYCNDIQMDGSISSYIHNKYLEEYDYLPFSKNNKYYETENLYRFGYNSYIDLRGYGQKCFEYAKNNIIKKIHHQMDDVEYTDADLPPLLDSRYTDGKGSFSY